MPTPARIETELPLHRVHPAVREEQAVEQATAAQAPAVLAGIRRRGTGRGVLPHTVRTHLTFMKVPKAPFRSLLAAKAWA